jgi:hypothetical protein
MPQSAHELPPPMPKDPQYVPPPRNPERPGPYIVAEVIPIEDQLKVGHAQGFTVRCDESGRIGGMDSAPSPWATSPAPWDSDSPHSSCRWHERVTLADREAEARARALHRGPTPVVVSHLVAACGTAGKTVWEKA